MPARLGDIRVSPVRNLFLVVALLLTFTPGRLAAQTFPDRGRNAVIDAAGVIPDAAEAALEARLLAWNRETGHQFVVATVPDLQGYEITDYGVALLRHWRLGRAEANDGVLLLLVPGERRVRIEVGYGLEPVLTDALASRIIRETIRPRLSEGDIADALTAGSARIMDAVAPPAPSPPLPPPRMEEKTSGTGVLVGVLIALAVIFGIIFLIVRRTRRRDGGLAHGPVDSGRSRDERRYATVQRAEERPSTGMRPTGDAAYGGGSGGQDALAALRERAWQDDRSDDDYDSGGGDSGFDGGGGSGGGGGADDSY
jgi:uncharacterized protein